MKRIKVNGEWVYPAHTDCDGTCPPECDRFERLVYRAGMALVSEATPQSHPNRFTDEEIKAEIKYLLRLNAKHGTHHLRVAAYLALDSVLADRMTCSQCGPGHAGSDGVCERHGKRIRSVAR